MSDIVGDLARVGNAFELPTLRLLHQRQAPIVIALFRTAFARDARAVPTPRLHEQVGTYLDELRLSGTPDVPVGSGREVCLRWMQGKWLDRDLDDDGAEVYLLTAAAQDALALVKSLTRERAVLSEHRIATLVNQARRLNVTVNPDRGERIRLLTAQIKRLEQERADLEAGGELAAVTDDYLLEGFIELLNLISALPSDFARVEEAFVTLRSDIQARLRADDRRAGDLVDDYLSQAETLMTATAEGRAFEGAFALLRDDELLLQLRQDVNALLEHPRAAEILNVTDQRDLRGMVGLIRDGMDDVVERRARVTTALRDVIITHDTTRDRELDELLGALDHELTEWMRTTGPRADVPVQLLPAKLSVTHLSEKFHDPSGEALPPPLPPVGEHPTDGALTLEELLTAGGPSLTALAAAIEDAVTGAAPASTVGEIFAAQAPEMQRPVEILGLLHLAVNHPRLGPVDGDQSERFDTIRSDGTRRALTAPRVSVHAPEGRPQEER